MKPYTFINVVLQILLLACTAQSFVMLTANMEDIKKLARKFVSDDLADKIAEFVVKATEQMTGGLNNLSDENDLNLQDNISDDNTKYKLRMAQPVKKPEPETAPKDYSEYKRDPPKDYKDRSEREPPAFYKKVDTTKRYDEASEARKHSRERNQAENSNRDRESKTKQLHKEAEDRSRERHSEELPPKKYNKYSGDERDLKVQKYYHPESERPDRVSPKIDIDIRNNKKHNDIPVYEVKYKHRDTTERFKIVTSKKSNEEASGERLPPNQRDEKRYRQRMNRTSDTGIITPDQKLKVADTNANQGGYRGLRASNFEFTTEKEKTDFDQYDNSNYPKAAKYVATSGPVMLPKMPGVNWWQNEETASPS